MKRALEDSTNAPGIQEKSVRQRLEEIKQRFGTYNASNYFLDSNKVRYILEE